MHGNGAGNQAYRNVENRQDRGIPDNPRFLVTDGREGRFCRRRLLHGADRLRYKHCRVFLRGDVCRDLLGYGRTIGYTYRFIWLPLVLVGAVIKLDIIWSIADAMNGLMAIPNLITLVVLAPVVVRLIRDFEGRFSRVQNAVEPHKIPVRSDAIHD